MALQLTDFLSINRGGSASNASSGTYYVITGQDILDMVAANLGDAISTDANQSMVLGSDNKLFVRNSAIAGDAAADTITFTDNLGNDTVLNMNDYVVDIYVNGASINATTNVLTLTDNDTGTPDVTVNLGAYRTAASHNATTGVTSITPGVGDTPVTRPAANWMGFTAAP